MDTFKCGQCELELHDLGQFLEHKQSCSSITTIDFPSEPEELSIPDIETKEDIVVEIIETPLDIPMIDKLTCQFCFKRFKRPFNLKVHLKTIHSEEKPFKCQTCDRAFKQKSNLKKHLASHKKEIDDKDTNPDCDESEMSFEVITRGGRKIAIEPTDPIKPSKEFVCDGCNGSFSTKWYLKKHKRLCERNSEDKPYQCSICDQAFTLQEYLKKHFLSHGDDSKYQCNVCDKIFKRSDIMKRHMKIHSDSPSKYKCPFSTLTNCSRAFYRQDKLKEHMKSHGNVKQLKCQICDELCIDEKALEEHSKIHGENEDNVVLYRMIETTGLL